MQQAIQAGDEGKILVFDFSYGLICFTVTNNLKSYYGLVTVIVLSLLTQQRFSFLYLLSFYMQTVRNCRLLFEHSNSVGGIYVPGVVGNASYRLRCKEHGFSRRTAVYNGYLSSVVAQYQDYFFTKLITRAVKHTRHWFWESPHLKAYGLEGKFYFLFLDENLIFIENEFFDLWNRNHVEVAIQGSKKEDLPAGVYLDQCYLLAIFVYYQFYYLFSCTHHNAQLALQSEKENAFEDCHAADWLTELDNWHFGLLLLLFAG